MSTAEQSLACGREALRVGRLLSTPDPERQDLAMLALINLRAAVHCLLPCWERAHAEDGARVAPVSPELSLLIDRSVTEDLSVEPPRLLDEVGRLTELAERLLEDVEAPRRLARAARLRGGALRLGAALAVALILVAAAWAWLGPRDVALGKPWSTSSTGAVCRPKAFSCGGAHTAVLFHTELEEEPWFELDLGRVHELGGVFVKNRQDACPECAVPLVAEVSLDRRDFRPVAHRFSTFSEWTQRFPETRARYVRLRVTRRSFLHLEQVRVYGRPVD